ncbi:RNA polymerase sigma factor SigJ [Phytomonospora endophytica]|uniref:RNA polymerase sigma-70 factor (ECF subfamily) n=1 Tax=Phytomonospora endophytica TaxID=714109 RepID=A0A841G0E8_9ACTN|nr:RNA polymerase sigma factor SigJ [Phytomonospora endophytica]MBB6037640.1 RNA polymerase sigma-70 factor (ECF subfamily) [Phytomonospora endophytica]GIG67833.1 RNA polymerase sigma24 factor [Phytomonospora endophytica]
MSPDYPALRPRAFAIAYRMLGSAAGAEDVVQEAFLRLHQAGATVESPPAFLATVVTRLAIDELRSARSRRESYVGEWLPEPVVTAPGPADRAETADTLSWAFLVLLESLSPTQRAAFLLREVFNYPYDEVATFVGTDVDNARHLVARARRHVREGRPRFYATPAQRDELGARFFAAMDTGDLASLEALLAEDVALYADGGGKAPSPQRAVFGRERVLQTLAAGFTLSAGLDKRTTFTSVNGQPGALVHDASDRLLAVLGVDIVDGRVAAIRSLVNPEKLAHLGPVGELRL